MLFKKSTKPATGRQQGLLSGLQAGLSKTRTLLLTDVRDLFGKGSVEKEALLEELETALLLADVGVESTSLIIEKLRNSVTGSHIQEPGKLLEALRNIMVDSLKQVESVIELPGRLTKPMVFLVVGVNGAGKTTTIGKLANLYKQKHSVLLIAGDTFRAAAIEQLDDWGKRNGVPVVARAHGSDSASVIYEGLTEASKSGAEIIIADTAGRLQNKSNLVDELKKIRRTISKFDPELVVETLLVLDASNGQNALVQAEQFHAEVGVSGIVLTKLDGSARGGIVFSIASRLNIPLRYVGTGEGLDDIATFNAEEFVDALLLSPA